MPGGILSNIHPSVPTGVDKRGACSRLATVAPASGAGFIVWTLGTRRARVGAATDVGRVTNPIV